MRKNCLDSFLATCILHASIESVPPYVCFPNCVFACCLSIPQHPEPAACLSICLFLLPDSPSVCLFTCFSFLFVLLLFLIIFLVGFVFSCFPSECRRRKADFVAYLMSAGCAFFQADPMEFWETPTSCKQILFALNNGLLRVSRKYTFSIFQQ